jgi:hypothetical protein
MTSLRRTRLYCGVMKISRALVATVVVHLSDELYGRANTDSGFAFCTSA